MFKQLFFISAVWLVGCGGADPGRGSSPMTETVVMATPEATTDAGLEGDAGITSPSNVDPATDAGAVADDDAGDGGSAPKAGAETTDSGTHAVMGEDAGADAANVVDTGTVDAGNPDVLSAKPVVRCKTSNAVYYCDDTYTGQGGTAITFYPSAGPAITCGGSHALTVGCTPGTTCTVLGGSYPSGTCE